MIDRAKELFAYRELLKNMVARELKIKYKRSILGAFWSLLNPLLMMVVYTAIFSFIFKAGIKNYPMFLLSALLPWNFFTFSLTSSVGAIISNAELVKKIYFPREILPISSVLAYSVDFLLQLLALLVFLTILGYKSYAFIPLIPFIIIIQLFFNIGIACLFSCLNVYYRDVQQFVGILTTAWFYGTPLVYTIDMIPDKFRWVFVLNPMSSIVLLYRTLLYDNQLPSLKLILYAIFFSTAMLIIGYFVFQRYSSDFPKEV